MASQMPAPQYLKQPFRRGLYNQMSSVPPSRIRPDDSWIRGPPPRVRPKPHRLSRVPTNMHSSYGRPLSPYRQPKSIDLFGSMTLNRVTLVRHRLFVGHLFV